MKQYTVSRRLTSAKEALLSALAYWSQQHLHKTVTSTALKDMTVILEEWLERYYVPQTLIDQADHVGDYYLAVEVDRDDQLLHIWGYTTHRISNLGVVGISACDGALCQLS